jgi:hypothetical protein
VRFAGAGVAEEHDRVTAVEVVTVRERGDRGRVDRGCGVEVEVDESLRAREACFVDPALASPFGALIDFGGEHAGLVGEDLEVVVEVEDLVALAATAMRRDDRRAVENVDGLGADPHVEPSPDAASRHRVVTLADTHPGFRVDTM